MPDPRVISLDIESYGACDFNAHSVRLPPQTVFHPRRSMATDGIALEDLILTCAITLPTFDPRAPLGTQYGRWWTGNDLAQLKPGDSMCFQMHRPWHRKWLRKWIRWADTIIGTNLPFDISYLRMVPEIRPLLNQNSHTLIDLMVLNFLHDETRPERSLKTLGPVLRTHRYGPETTLKFKRFLSPLDPDLHVYNCSDTHNTILAVAELARRVIVEFGDTPHEENPGLPDEAYPGRRDPR